MAPLCEDQIALQVGYSINDYGIRKNDVQQNVTAFIGSGLTAPLGFPPEPAQVPGMYSRPVTVFEPMALPGGTLMHWSIIDPSGTSANLS